MANTSVSTLLVILFWGLTLATGRKLSPLSTTTTLSSSPSDGICLSMVMPQVQSLAETILAQALLTSRLNFGLVRVSFP